jgi:hypothetical protein
MMDFIKFFGTYSKRVHDKDMESQRGCCRQHALVLMRGNPGTGPGSHKLNFRVLGKLHWPEYSPVVLPRCDGCVVFVVTEEIQAKSSYHYRKKEQYCRRKSLFCCIM